MHDAMTTPLDPGSIFGLLSLILVTAAAFAWFNHRYVKLPTTIGVLVTALAMSLGLQILDVFGLPVRDYAESLLKQVGFSESLLEVMLAFLLFAGALHVDLDRLRREGWVIAVLATAGVVVSTILVGGMTYLLCHLLDVPVAPIECLLFGAIVSPTDPIAVLGILKSAGVPETIETKITGESLFNDGFAVVVFAVLAKLATDIQSGAGETIGVTQVLELVSLEVFGALVLGAVAGSVAYRMLKSVDNYQLEVLITLALCSGVYSLASAIHSSGPLAVVVAGLLIGNTGRRYAMSERTVEHLDTFWELVDEILNVILFVLIGMEVLVITFYGPHVMAGLLAIPLVIAARWIAVGGTVFVLGSRRRFSRHVVVIMTWAGLRGGISVALALSLPATLAARPVLLTMTYIVVIFSIVVQGLTVGRLVKRLADVQQPLLPSA